MGRVYCVYILTNWDDSVMYIGVTNDLIRRIHEHKNKTIKGFTRTYNVFKLVHFETTENIESAITREKELKSWRREKKNKLVANSNPEWKDLFETIL